jgi:ABC-type multidrug transport system fused ATPase/permease subunit
MKSYLEILAILEKPQKISLLFMAILCFIGMVFEIGGLGLLIPSLTIILKSNIAVQYPILKPILQSLGNPSQETLILWSMTSFLLFFMIKMVFMIYLTYKQSSYVAKISDNLSKRLFEGYLRQPYAYHLETNSATLLRNIQSEVNNYCEVIKSFLILLLELLTSIGIALFLFVWQPWGTLITSLLMISSVFIFFKSTKQIVYKWGLIRQSHESHINKHLLQGLGGVKEVKLMGKEDFFLHEFFKYNTIKTKTIAKQLSLIQVPRLYLEFLAVLGIVSLVFLSIYRNINLENLLTILGVYMAASFRLIPSVNRIMSSFQTIKFHQPVVNLLYNELKQFNVDFHYKNDNGKIEFKKEIQLNNISFHYSTDKRLVLKDINIIINKGDCIGIVGQSGSGKSTLIDLILGLIFPVNGAILIDGINIQENLRKWQNLIGYVPQTIYLNDASLKSNIAFGIQEDKVDFNSLQNAINCAMLDDFVKNLPDGIDTLIGERGTKLSGGQRQRIGIARALYHNPELLVLDEATSALDNETEREVMKAVNGLQGTKTIIIVAHRHSTLLKCDKIYEFSKGNIIKIGSPKEFSIG